MLPGQVGDSMMSKSDKLDAALQYLEELIEQGWEYPDAHPKAAMKFKVDADELQALYDNK